MFIPDFAPGERLGRFQQGETAGVVSLGFQLAQLFGWFEEGEKEALLAGAGADDPSGDAVDGGIEKVESDVGPIQGVAADDLFENRFRRIVEEDDVVTVPADAAADVGQEAGDKLKSAGDLFGNRFSRVEMTRIEAEADLVLHRVA